MKFFLDPEFEQAFCSFWLRSSGNSSFKASTLKFTSITFISKREPCLLAIIDKNLTHASHFHFASDQLNFIVVVGHVIEN